jgi:hypothetical protein
LSFAAIVRGKRVSSHLGSAPRRAALLAINYFGYQSVSAIQETSLISISKHPTNKYTCLRTTVSRNFIKQGGMDGVPIVALWFVAHFHEPPDRPYQAVAYDIGSR